MPAIPVPEIKASDYFGLADYVLPATGTTIMVRTGPGATDFTACTGSGALACPSGWTTDGAGNWSATGAMPSSATYYVQGTAAVHGTGKSTLTAVSIIAEGSLIINGNGKFKPENDSKIQFVTNGDFELLGNADADDPTDMDGQILVREQMKITGNSEFQGRVMVENRDGTTNAYSGSNLNGRRGASSFATNDALGNMTVTYNGSLGGITVTTPGAGATYQNIISGWMEQ
jgi:hypothetical protein